MHIRLERVYVPLFEIRCHGLCFHGVDRIIFLSPAVKP